MKKASLATVLLALGAGTAGAQAFPLRGSDTLFVFTEELIDICTPDISPMTELFYQGGGSGLGANEMSASRQDIAPMSRFLGNNASECDRFGADLGQGCQVALDGLSVAAEDDGGTCNTLRHSGFMEVLPGANGNGTLECPSCVDGPDTDGVLDHYEFTDWRDVLRIIYGGQHAHVAATACSLSNPSASLMSAQSCSSDVRFTLANSWGQIFEEGVGCTTGDPDGCTQLKHAFRRDDASGTTEVFLEVLGLPGFQSGSRSSASIRPQRTFCNGLEGEEKDPIRRDCDLSDPGGNTGWQNVCNPARIANRGPENQIDTVPGTLDPITAYDDTLDRYIAGPATDPGGDVGDLGLVLPMMIPEEQNHPYGEVRCNNVPNRGSFGLVVMPNTSVASRPCPNGASRQGGLCYWPLQSGTTASAPDYECTAHKMNRQGAPFRQIDGRAYNLIPRNPNGTFKTIERIDPNDDSVLQRKVLFATYRLHELTVMPGGTYTTSPTLGTCDPGTMTFSGCPLYPAATEGEGCQLPDATQQIGCLVGASPCSIGFAGLTALAVNPQPQKGLSVRARNPAYGAIPPTEPMIRRINDSLTTCTPGTAGLQLDGRYPLARGLWINALKGFDTSGTPLSIDFDNIVNTRREQDLIRCACDRHFADRAAVAANFITNTDLDVPATHCTTASPLWTGDTTDAEPCDTPLRTCAP